MLSLIMVVLVSLFSISQSYFVTPYLPLFNNPSHIESEPKPFHSPVNIPLHPALVEESEDDLSGRFILKKILRIATKKAILKLKYENKEQSTRIDQLEES